MNGSALPEALPGLAGPNPFVGPRPFELGERLYGREREIGELHLRLNAERIVLLHSPSGAGKSSLVQAGLVPLLAKAFDVWGPTRVNAEPADAGANRYVLSAVQGFEEGVPKAFRRPVQVLAGQTLAGYFEKRPRRRAAPQNVVLLCDQFEEILTVDPLAVEAKHAFFEQLGELLRNPRVWALFALREDYLAPLDPYARQVPTHLKNRFRIDLLGLAAAREAMVEPARQGDREFPAVDELVTDLATMKVQQPDGTFVEETGQHVEPVQLQVVCRRLWDAMPPEDLSIDAEDLERFGDVTEALAAYYADSVARTSGGDPARERAIRDWFGEALITAGGIRGQVLREAEASDGLANDLIDRLRGTHLVRAEKRAGATWYELAHDRLIEPVQRDNAAWRERHLADVQRRAALWERQGRPPGLLLAGAELAEAERWAAENGARITEVERRFLAESRKAREIAEQERRQARRIRRLAIAATIVGVLAVVACVLAAWQWRQAEAQTADAKAQRKEAEDQTNIAKKEKTKAEMLGIIADLKSVEAEEAKDDAFRQKGIAVQESARAKAEEMRAQAARFEAQRAAARVDVELAEKLIADGRRREALAYLARAVRFAPENSATRGRVFALLFGVSYPIPSADNPIRHERSFIAASFSPDGQRVLTLSRDNKARLWDAATGELLHDLAYRGEIKSAAFNADGQRVVTVTDRAAQVWSVATGELLETPIHDWSLSFASFSPDGRQVVTVSADKRAVRVWDAERGKWSSKPISHPGPIDSASLSPNGQRVAATSLGGGAWLWNAATGERLENALPPEAAIMSASFSPDGQRVVTTPRGGSASTAQLWDAATGEQLETLSHDWRVSSASFSPDGRLVVTVSLQSVDLSGAYAQVWDTATGKPRATLRRIGGIDSASFSPDGKQVVTTSSQSGVRLWDGEGKVLSDLEVVGIRSLSFSPDGQRLLTVDEQGAVRFWDVRPGKLIGEPLRFPGGFQSMSTWLRLGSNRLPLSLSPDSRRVVAGSDDGTARVFDVATGRPLGDLGAVDSLTDASFSPDSRWVVTTSGGIVQVWNAETGKRFGRPMDHGSWVDSGSFFPDAYRVVTTSLSPDARRVVTTSRGKAQVWNAKTGRRLWGPMDDGSWVNSASFSPDGQRLVTASDDDAQLWDAETGKQLGAPMDHDARVLSASFSLDGKRVMTTTHSIVWLWDLATGKPVGQQIQHAKPLKFATFSPDGQRVVTADDGTARLWDAMTGRSLGEPLFPDSWTSFVAGRFSPDGQRLTTAFIIGTARLWDVPTASAAEAGLLAEVAEVIGGYAVTNLGNLEPISLQERSKRMAELRRLGERAPDHQPTVASFLRWYFAPRFERTISPLSKMTVAEYIKQLLALGTPEARQEAEEAFPGHPLLAERQP